MRFEPRLLALIAAAAAMPLFAASGIPSASGSSPARALQASLPLTEAIRMALERNGQVTGAGLDTIAAHARVTQANAAFYPSITPDYNYSDVHSDGFGQPASFSGQSYRSTTSDIVADWVLFDSGRRLTALRGQESGARAIEHDERQERRSVVFETTSRYYNALRGAELLRVAQAQVDRAKTVYDSTVARVNAGDLAQKETLQAKADLMNAQVAVIQARLTEQTGENDLRVTIGWPSDQPLPALVPPAKPEPPTSLPPSTDYEKRGVERRPDLLAAQDSIRALGYTLRQAEMDSRITWQLRGSLSRRLEMENGFQRQLTLAASIPLFDAGQSRAVVRETRASRDAAMARYEQQERQVRADIKSAYLTYSLRGESLAAAAAALEAASLNYEAAAESQRVGAGTLPDVIIAQAALVTAETNYVQAEYDWYVAQVQLTYTAGDPLQGETK